MSGRNIPAINSFDPQALTSLTLVHTGDDPVLVRFDPQALTSLTFLVFVIRIYISRFRSTGSYEPDRDTRTGSWSVRKVSIHRLKRA